jgi:hypothetical protein
MQVFSFEKGQMHTPVVRSYSGELDPSHGKFSNSSHNN